MFSFLLNVHHFSRCSVTNFLGHCSLHSALPLNHLRKTASLTGSPKKLAREKAIQCKFSFTTALQIIEVGQIKIKSVLLICLC